MGLEPCLATTWNKDDPRDAALIVQNLTNLLRRIARRARLRQPPTVAMAQDWHRQIYKGVNCPFPTMRVRSATAI